MRRLLRWSLIVGGLIGLMLAVALPAAAWWRLRSQPKYQTATVSRGL